MELPINNLLDQNRDSRKNSIPDRLRSFGTGNGPENAGRFKDWVPGREGGPSRDPELEQYFPRELQGKIATGEAKRKLDVQEQIARDPERKRLFDAAREFQAIFLNMMLKSMRASLNKKDDLLYGGNRQDIFEDMLYNEYSKSLSSSPGFDLADRIYEDLSRKMAPLPTDGSKVRSEYEENMRRMDGTVPTEGRKNSWEWSY